MPRVWMHRNRSQSRSDNIKLIMTKTQQTNSPSPVFELGVKNNANWQDLMDALVQRRVELGISQREMAKRLGISQPAVAQFELSSANPTISTLIRYANKLGVELEWNLATSKL